MLTFLRHIRKGLLGDGQARKYMVYAIGEIALVVIGILIALQINNWNESRQTQNKVKLQLVNLTNAIQSDLVNYNLVLRNEGFRFHAIKYLLEMAGETIRFYDGYSYDKYPARWESIWNKPIPEDFDREFVMVCFSMIDLGTLGSIVNNTAIQEFSSSGLFSELSNTELKMKITEYYRLANMWYSGKSWDYNTELTLKVRELLENQYQIDARRMEDVKDPIGLIRENKLLVIKLHTLLDKISLTCERILGSKKKVEEVISSINQELAHAD